MGIFEYADQDGAPQDKTDTWTMSVRDNSIKGRDSFNHTIPKDLVDKFDINTQDKLVIEETENGWKVSVLEI